jgi:hypothetical protein
MGKTAAERWLGRWPHLLYSTQGEEENNAEQGKAHCVQWLSASSYSLAAPS